MSSWNPLLTAADGPLYLAIVDELASAIGAGTLTPGDRLPTHRELARRVGASLGTVTRAYEEAERRGLVEGHVGRGTFVRDLTDPDSYSPMVDRNRIDLGPTAVPMHPGDPGHRALGAALTDLGSRADLVALSGYQHSGGTMPQRAAGARWLALQGVDAPAEEVTLCGGAQHGTVLLLMQLAGAEGVLVEEVTYPGLIAAMRWLRIPAHPVALDADGLVPEALARAARETGARVLYCTPTHHNPTAAVTPLARREAIAAVCREYGITIIENGALAPLVAGAPPPLAALAPERTCYVTTLSKATVPALRVGYVHTPASVCAPLDVGVAATVWSASPLLAEIATRWIDGGTAESIRDWRRAEAAARETLAASALRPHGYRPREGAYFSWLPLPDHLPALDMVAEAASRGVLIGPGHLFAARPGSAPNAVRLSLAAPASRAKLERGLAVVTEILRNGITRAGPVL
jgi:DNA-binding transcriptional MocR family regulator